MRESVHHCKTEFERARRVRIDESHSLSDIRWQALEQFLTLGFPQSHHGVRGDVGAHSFTIGSSPIAATAFSNFEMAGKPASLELVYGNGYLQRRVTAPSACDVSDAPIGTMFARNDATVEIHFGQVAARAGGSMAALNTALFAQGSCVVIGAGVSLEDPVCVQFVSTGEADLRPAMTHPRLLVVVGAGSRMSLIETHTSVTATAYLTNAVTEIVLGANARLDYYRLQSDGDAAFHTGTVCVQAENGAHCGLHLFNLGGAIVRSDVTVFLDGADSGCTIRALDVCAAARVIDAFTGVEHVDPTSFSEQDVRSIVAAGGAMTFEGRLALHHAGSACDAHHQTLLLADSAEGQAAFRTFSFSGSKLVPERWWPGEVLRKTSASDIDRVFGRLRDDMLAPLPYVSMREAVTSVLRRLR